MVRILLLGGHGRVALHITRLLAARGHHVTSIIRNPAHVADVAALGPSSLIAPTVSSIEHAPDAAAEEMMDGIDWVVWSAGTLSPSPAPHTPR